MRDLAAIRSELIAEFCDLPDRGDPLIWQVKIAREIILSEKGDGVHDSRELKEHRKLLRIIADSLPFEILPSHTIRVLGRPSNPPVSISNQGDDFAFTLQVAAKFRAKGFVPILSDLTTLLNLGDIACWREDQLVIVECKNKLKPDRIRNGGRLARQQERGRVGESYLRSSAIEEPVDSRRYAVDGFVPEPDWRAVQTVLESCLKSEDGTSFVSLGVNDYLFALDFRREDLVPADEFILPLGDFEKGAVAFYSDLMKGAGFRTPAPPNYPLPAELRCLLLEGDLALWRMVDMKQIESDFSYGAAHVRLEAVSRAETTEVRVSGVGGDCDFTFTSALVDCCVWSPIPLIEMRKFLLQHAKDVISAIQEPSGMANIVAVGDKVTYATAYRDNTDDLLCIKDK